MKDLQSPLDSKVKSSLERARSKGTLDWVVPLLQAFQSRPEDALKEEMRGMLGSLKLSGAEAVFLSALEDAHFEDIRADILGFLWSCGFVCDGHLAVVAEHACEGDFRAAMEGATLIEQVESIADEQDAMDALVVIKEAMTDSEKKEIAPFLDAMRQHLTMLSDAII